MDQQLLMRLNVLSVIEFKEIHLFDFDAFGVPRLINTNLTNAQCGAVKLMP